MRVCMSKSHDICMKGIQRRKKGAKNIPFVAVKINATN